MGIFKRLLRIMSIGALAALLTVGALSLAGSAANAVATPNLVLNGAGGLYGCTPNNRSVTAADHWNTVFSAPRLVQLTSTSPSYLTGDQSDFCLFAGAQADHSEMFQSISLANWRPAIAAGIATYDFGSFLGGHENQADYATAAAEFYDGANTLVSRTVLGPVTAADRGNQSGMRWRQATGSVPPQARSVTIRVHMYRFVGNDNNGYADGITFTIDPVDVTPPTVVGVPDRPANSHGWYNAAVTLDWQASEDAPSAGAPTDPPNTVAATEGASVTYTSAPSCDPNANCATGSVSLSIDVTPPSLQLPATVSADTPGTGATVLYTAGASDSLSGLETFGCAPASGSVFTVGTTRVTCNAIDRAGNVAEGGFDVVVNFVDPTPPSVTATVTGTAGNNDWYTSDVTITWSISDAESPFTTSGCDEAGLTTDTTGTTVTCSATSAGGATTESVTVKIDRTPPVIAPLATPAVVEVGQAVAVDAGASDAHSGLASVVCDDPSTSQAGTFTVNCTAVDNAGNAATASVSYTVLEPASEYVFGGFLPPVQPMPSVNAGRAGRTIPLKWTLSTAGGAAVVDLRVISSVTYVSVTCAATHEPIGVAHVASSAGESGLRVVDGVFQFNWAAPGTAGCYRVDINLVSGQTFGALFDLS